MSPPLDYRDVFWYKYFMNRLEYLVEFQKILADYHVSSAGKKILEEIELVLLVAPSGGGRNTVISELLKSGKYDFVVSDTTRLPRINNGSLEQSGREYWFRTEEEILQDLKDGKFLEAEVIHNQQVSGISIRELKKALTHSKIAITDIDIGGVQNIMAAKEDTLAIVVLPPSFDEWQRRIFTRGSIEPTEYKRRMHTARTIFTEALKHDYFSFVINHTIEQTAKEIDAIAQVKDIDAKEKLKAKQLIEQLLQEINASLEKI